MPTRDHIQLTFGGGANAVAPSHAVGEQEVITATNIDFGLEDGAAGVRRGNRKLGNCGSSAITQIERRYTSPIGSSPFYVVSGSALHRWSGTGAGTPIGPSANSARVGFSSYRDHAYLTVNLGPDAFKDNGTSTVDWVKVSPTTAPTIGSATLTGLDLNDTWTVAEGTLGTQGAGTATATTDEDTNRIEFDMVLTTTNLNTNGGNTIGDYGIDYLTVQFDYPSLIRRVSRDYSIGNADFTNYWHTEMDVIMSYEAMPDTEDLVDSLLTKGDSTTDGVDEETRAAMTAWARTALRAPRTRISAAANSPNVWTVPRTKFELISKEDIPEGWDDIKKVRVVIECYGQVIAIVKDWEIKGAETYPLNDADLGYAWWETWATIDGEGNIVDESAPSPPSARTQMQNSRALCTLGAASSDTELTHRVLWRQGGYLRSPYPVGTATMGAGTAVMTDTVSDMEVLSERREMPIDLLTQAAFPNNIVAASEPFHDRIFVGYANHLRWSKPGNPTAFPSFSEAVVSHSGDAIQALHSWGRLVIVNRDSVYEMDGSIFEGSGQDWVLQRSGSKRGSFAPDSIIKTPYGILLLDWDGIYMYMPGQGVDVEVSWAMEKLADAFRGSLADDPATLKGSRVPPINRGYLQDSCAAYADGKVYIAMPTGSDTKARTVFVLDFRTKRVWWYTYAFYIQSLFWDRQENRLLAGTSAGSIMQLEHRIPETLDNASTTSVGWSFKTRKWTTPNDTVVENIAVDHAGDATVVKAIYDGTSTVTVGTYTNTARDWKVSPLSGTVGNSVEFEFSGTRTASTQQAVYGVGWDALVEPTRVQYYKTDYFDADYDGEKQWDVLFSEMEVLGTGSVYGTAYVDGVVIMTATITGPTAGKIIQSDSFPVDTYGDVAHVVYTASGSVYFKLWSTTYASRKEPPPVNSWKTDITSMEEQICDAVDVDINPNGTVLSTVYVDNTAVDTGTFIGTKRQSFTEALPNNTYGRTIYAVHNGTAFKHYQTWFHLREEPDRWTNFVTDRTSGNEKEWKTVEIDVDCLAGTVLSTIYLDNSAIGTYTFTGAVRQSAVKALPLKSHGRTIWAVHNASGSGKFKHYNTWFEGNDEPDRVLTAHHGPVALPSNANLKTWLTELDCLSGNVIGTFMADGTAISTDTFTGSENEIFVTELDITSAALTTATQVEAIYNGTAVFKHYWTRLEMEPKPFGKKQWAFGYKKLGGASQLDMGRFWSLDIEPEGTATITSVWEIDGAAHQTNTLTFTAREYRDRIAFDPGARGQLFQLRLSSGQNFEVYRAQVDMGRVGVKELSRSGYRGTPPEKIDYA